VWREERHSDVFLTTDADRAAAGIARQQFGVISSAQLHALGLQRGAIRRRLERGQLHRIHRGVYAVGHTRLSYRGKLWAALLACGGPGAAVLSHRSAAAVWELIPTPAGHPDVTTLKASRSLPAVRVHRSTTLTADDIVEKEGLPVTTVARTLRELATQVTPHRLERICHRAAHLRVLDAAVLADSHGALKKALQTLERREPQITRSKLEERFLKLIAQAKLPRPEVNVTVEGHEVDFFWSEHRLMVETDGAATHLTPIAFEDDRARDARLTAAGYRVVRFTRRQVTERPRAVASTLSALLP
jgi:very-short-patch-repair endonuclease